MLWGNRTKISGAGTHFLPIGAAGLCNSLENIGVKHLVVSNDWNTNNESLVAIAQKCKHTLIELSIHKSVATDLSPLSTLQNLKRLTFTNSQHLSPGSLASLSIYTSHISRLEELNLSGCGSALDDNAVTAIAHAHGKYLRLCNISHTDCSDVGAIAIGNHCNRLTQLNVSHTFIKGKGLNCIIANNPKLIDIEATHLLHTSGRVSLVSVQTNGVAAFEHNLITLNLHGCESVRNACCFWIRTFVSLKSLDVSKCAQLSDSGMVELSKLTNLEKLRVRQLPLVTTVGASVLLRELRKMQSCDFSFCQGIDDHPFELWSRQEEVFFLPPARLDPVVVKKALKDIKQKEKEKIYGSSSSSNGSKSKSKKNRKLPSRSLVDLEVTGMRLITPKGLNAICARVGMRRIVCMESCATSASLRTLARSNHETLQILHLSGTFDEQGMLALAGCTELVELILAPMLIRQTRGVGIDGKSETAPSSYNDRSILSILSGCKKLTKLNLQNANELYGEWSRQYMNHPESRGSSRSCNRSHSRSSSRSNSRSKTSSPSSSSSSSSYVWYKLESLILKNCKRINPNEITTFVKECPSLKHIEIEKCSHSLSKSQQHFNQITLLNIMPDYSTYIGKDIGVGPLNDRYKIQDRFFKKHTQLIIAILKSQKIARGWLLRFKVWQWHQAALIIQCSWRQKVARDCAFDLLTAYRLRIATAFFDRAQNKWKESTYQAWKTFYEEKKAAKLKKALKFCRQIQMKCVVLCLTAWKGDMALKRRVKALGDRVFRGRISHYFDLWLNGIYSIIDQRVSYFLIPLQALARGFVYRTTTLRKRKYQSKSSLTNKWENRRHGANELQRIWRGCIDRTKVTTLCLTISWKIWSPEYNAYETKKIIKQSNNIRNKVYTKLKRDYLEIKWMFTWYTSKLITANLKQIKKHAIVANLLDRISVITPMVQNSRKIPVPKTTKELIQFEEMLLQEKATKKLEEV